MPIAMPAARPARPQAKPDARCAYPSNRKYGELTASLYGLTSDSAPQVDWRDDTHALRNVMESHKLCAPLPLLAGLQGRVSIHATAGFLNMASNAWRIGGDGEGEGGALPVLMMTEMMRP